MPGQIIIAVPRAKGAGRHTGQGTDSHNLLLGVPQALEQQVLLLNDELQAASTAGQGS